MDLALNNLQRLMYHKTQMTNQHLLIYTQKNTPQNTDTAANILNTWDYII